MAAERADLNGILDQLKTIFDSKNTIGASPIDLSSDLNQRVKKVLTVNPDYIEPQASHFPFVTSFITSKSIDLDDIAGSQQLQGFREATIGIEIVGGVFNSKTADLTKDPADRDINYLMENIELILRSDYNLGRKIKWQKADSVQYYSTFSAKNHIRIGVLKLNAKIFY